MRKSKRRGGVLAALALCLCLAGCGGKAAEADLHEALEEMLAEAPIAESMELTEEDMLNFYGIRADQMEDFAAVTCSMGIEADELVLVKAADEDSAQEIEALLQQRLENRKSEFRNYSPEEYEILTKGSVERDGVYVRLIVSPQSEELAAIYDGCFQ